MKRLLLAMILIAVFALPAFAADCYKALRQYHICAALITGTIEYIVLTGDCQNVKDVFYTYDNYDDAKRTKDLNNSSAFSECLATNRLNERRKDLEKAKWEEIE